MHHLQTFLYNSYSMDLNKTVEKKSFFFFNFFVFTVQLNVTSFFDLKENLFTRPAYKTKDCLCSSSG